MQLKIYSSIVTDQEQAYLEYFGEGGVSFSTVDDFIASIPEDDNSIDLRINCPGGDVATGWAIVDKLRATGKKISATIEGTAASMAVTVLLAASERKAYKHASLLIHKPYFPEYTLSGAYNEDDLEKLQNQLHDSTEKMLDFMAERTGTDKAKLEKLMEEDRLIDMEEAKEYGFITEILEPLSAKSRWPGQQSKQHPNNMAKENTEMSLARKAVVALASVFGLNVQVVEDKNTEPEPKNYKLATESGGEITIDKPEGQDPAVGDSASPDGNHKMPDGTTIVIEDGKISDILPAETEDDDKKDAGKKKQKDEGTDPEPKDNGEDPAPKDDNTDPDPKDQEIEQLKAELDALKAEKDQLTTQVKNQDESEILDMVEKAGGKAWLQGVAKSAYVVAQRKAKLQNQTVNTSVENELAALKEKLAKQR